MEFQEFRDADEERAAAATHDGSFPMDEPDPAEIAELSERLARRDARRREAEERESAPDEPFPLHPFDPAEGQPDACAAWRVVQGGDRQHCAYAASDPVHLASAR